MNTFSKVCGCDHLHNNSSVVSEIRKERFLPPNKTTTRNSGPNPITTAECPYRGVILAGRVICRTTETHFLMCNCTAA